MIPGNRSLRKTCSIARADQASARRHLAGLVTSGQLRPDLPGGYVVAGLPWPSLAYCDNTGEPLAGKLRPGGAGSKHLTPVRWSRTLCAALHGALWRLKRGLTPPLISPGSHSGEDGA